MTTPLLRVNLLASGPWDSRARIMRQARRQLAELESLIDDAATLRDLVVLPVECLRCGAAGTACSAHNTIVLERAKIDLERYEKAFEHAWERLVATIGNAS